MPPGPGSPEQLRQRSAVLRITASKLDASPALVLYRRAGDDVWRGPTPARCLDDLLRMRTELLAAADELRANARQLDLRADQIDADARTRAAATAGGAG